MRFVRYAIGWAKYGAIMGIAAVASRLLKDDPEPDPEVKWAWEKYETSVEHREAEMKRD